MGFPSDIQEKALVACARSCCLCHKFCSFKIELHHIIQKADAGEDTFDNCIPLCLDCHADVKAYNLRHPKGKKYTESELKAHRDQWYQKNQNINQADSLLFESIHEMKKENKGTKRTTQNTENNHREGDGNDINSSGSVNYTFSSPEIFRKELEVQCDRIKNLNEEKQSAFDLGFKESLKATEREIEVIQLQIQILKKRIEIIEQGYEYWDKIEFLLACEANYMFDSWHSIGIVENGQFTANEETYIRIPQKTYKSLKPAINSMLFKEFLLCVAVEPHDDPDDFLGQWIEYYLFGSPPNINTSENDDLFLIDVWNDDGFE